MYLTRLSLTHFRNFARLDMDIPRRVILLAGNNAQGKTSLLEAIYFLATMTSFQTNTDRQLVNFLAASESLAVGRIVAEFSREKSAHRLEIRLILDSANGNGKRLRKEILLDGVRRKAVDAVGIFNASLFVPQMSQIIEGSPEERRRYLNMTLSQVTPSYVRALTDYTRALSQRNALLKQLQERGGDQNQLSFWEDTLAEKGAFLIFSRIRGIRELERIAARIHERLTRGSEILRLVYQPSCAPEDSSAPMESIRRHFRRRLESLRRQEIARGVTTIGPHRDEFRFLANGIDLGHYGSRGQIRTALLSLKLAEGDWMKEKTGEFPVILLDEIMAELDPLRREDLLSYLKKSEQAFLTTTDVKFFPSPFLSEIALWKIEEGKIFPTPTKGDEHAY